jgi:hypothetical protein
MSWVDVVKTAFKDQRRMSGLLLETKTPIPDISYLRAVESAARWFSFTGWIELTPANTIKAELMGEYHDLHKFLSRLELGKITATPIIVDSMWTAYRDRYGSIGLRYPLQRAS